MKRVNRLVSTAVLICFIFNTAVSDLAFGQSVNLSLNSDKLAALNIAAKTDDILGVELQDIRAISMWFKACLDLLEMKNIPITAENLKDRRKLPKEAADGLKNTQIFIREAAEDPSNGVIKIMARRRHGVSMREYHIEYSPAEKLMRVYPEGKAPTEEANLPTRDYTAGDVGRKDSKAGRASASGESAQKPGETAIIAKDLGAAADENARIKELLLMEEIKKAIVSPHDIRLLNKAIESAIAIAKTKGHASKEAVDVFKQVALQTKFDIISERAREIYFIQPLVDLDPGLENSEACLAHLLLTDHNEYVRSQAARTLAFGGMESYSEYTIEALRSGAKDPNPYVSSPCNTALQKRGLSIDQSSRASASGSVNVFPITREAIDYASALLKASIEELVKITPDVEEYFIEVFRAAEAVLERLKTEEREGIIYLRDDEIVSKMENYSKAIVRERGLHDKFERTSRQSEDSIVWTALSYLHTALPPLATNSDKSMIINPSMLSLTYMPGARENVFKSAGYFPIEGVEEIFSPRRDWDLSPAVARDISHADLKFRAALVMLMSRLAQHGAILEEVGKDGRTASIRLTDKRIFGKPLMMKLWIHNDHGIETRKFDVHDSSTPASSLTPIRSVGNTGEMKFLAGIEEFLRSDNTDDEKARASASGRCVMENAAELDPYSRTIEEDMKSFIEADKVMVIKPDGKIVSAKTGKSIDKEYYAAKVIRENRTALLSFWTDNGVNPFEKVGQKTLTDMAQKAIELLDKRIEELESPMMNQYPGDWDKNLPENSRCKDLSYSLKKMSEESASEVNDRYVQALINLSIFRKELQDLIGERYSAITGKKIFSYKCTEEDMKVIPALVEKVMEWIRIAQSSDICFVAEGPFSPRTRISSYNTIDSSGKATIWLDGLALWPLLNEAMHVDTKSRSHGKISSLSDIGKVNEHFGDYVEWDFGTKVDKDQFPWRPLLPGDNVGKSQTIKQFFGQLENFVRSGNVALIEGPTGIGKNMAVDAIQEMMGLKEGDMRIFGCSQIAGLSSAEMNEFLFGGRTRADGTRDIGIIEQALKGGLLVINDLPKASPALQNNLLDLLDGKFVTLSNGERLDISKLKIVCLANEEMELKPEFANRLKERIVVPSLRNRGDDIVILAEYFNYKASEANHIPWAPIDRYMGKLLINRIQSFTERKDGGNIRQLENTVDSIVANRAAVLKSKKLPEKTLGGNEWRCSKYFSPYLVTYADLVYAMNPVEIGLIASFDLEGNYYPIDDRNITKCIDLTYTNHDLLPYFEELAPRDANGNIVGFYKGPFPFAPFLESESIRASASGGREELISRIRNLTTAGIDASLTPLEFLLREGRKDEFMRLAKAAQDAGAASLHLDIFDPNLVEPAKNAPEGNMDVFTPQLVKGLREAGIDIPIHAHLMVRIVADGEKEPKLRHSLRSAEDFKNYIGEFINNGANIVTVHHAAFSPEPGLAALPESDYRNGDRKNDLIEVMEFIRENNAVCGLAINPGEDAGKALGEFKGHFDFPLVMTVVPGDGGRGFDERGKENIAAGRAAVTEGNATFIAADGAINSGNIRELHERGVIFPTVGSAYFGNKENLNAPEGIKEVHDRLVGRINIPSSDNSETRLSASGYESQVTGPVLEEIMKMVPAEWLDGWLNLGLFAQALREAGCEQSVVSSDDKSVLIFSERATFGEYKDGDYEEGLGVLLPSLAKSGVKVAAVAVTDRQKALIEELNADLLENQRIVYADSVAEVTAKAKAARYYYYKVASEPDAGISGVNSITIIVKKIIDAIGKVAKITDSRLIEQMHEAARKFAIAA